MERLFSLHVSQVRKKKINWIPFQLSCIYRWFTISFPGEKVLEQNKTKQNKTQTKQKPWKNNYQDSLWVWSPTYSIHWQIAVLKEDCTEHEVSKIFNWPWSYTEAEMRYANGAHRNEGRGEGFLFLEAEVRQYSVGSHHRENTPKNIYKKTVNSGELSWDDLGN